MAACIRFVCQHCSETIDSWDEGDPYSIDDCGNKRYAYHPQAERELCVGTDLPHLCLDCAERFAVDSRFPITSCPACQSGKIVPAFELGGQVCPACKLGIFRRDPDFFCIS